MSNAKHSAQTVSDGIHIAHAFTYANAAARTGDTGRALADCGKIAWQLDNNSFWALVSIAPTWIELTTTALPAHHVTHEPGGSDPLAIDAAAATGSLRTIGTGALQACAGNDARLSDARTPASHHTSHEPGGGDAMAVDAAAATGSLRTIGTGALQACAGNDSRLSNSRTPTAHAASHQNGGSDEVATATAGANAIPKAGAAAKLDIGWFPTGASGTTVCIGNDSRLSDARPPTAHASTHNAGGSDAMAIDAAAGTGSLRTLGTSATAACAGNDARLSNARAPTAHASTHQNGGSDEVATATAAANAIPKAGAGAKLDVAWLPTGTASTTVCIGNDSRLSDARTPTAHAASHNAGGGDALAIDAAAGTGSLRTLGTNATAACSGNDARLSDNRTDANALHRNVSAEISALTEKTTPAAADLLVIEDSAASNAKKKLQVGNLPAATLRYLQSAMAEVTVDTTTTSATWADLVTLNITTGANILLLCASASFTCSNGSARLMGLRLLVDGVEMRAATVGSDSTANGEALAIVYRKAVTAAAHVVKLQWKVESGYTIRCRPVAQPDVEHCCLVVEEVTQ